MVTNNVGKAVLNFFLVICVIVFSLFSCTTDNEKTGIYYVHHDNGNDEYLIVKPDNTYNQFIITNGNINEYNNEIMQINEDEITTDHDTKARSVYFMNYHNGFDPPYPGHESNDSTYSLFATFTSSLFGVPQIIIEYNMDVYAYKISPSYNSDSLLSSLRSKTKDI